MKNNLCLAFLLVSNWQLCLSENIQGDINKNTEKNARIEEDTTNSRSYLNIFNENVQKTNIRGIPINNFSPDRNGKQGDVFVVGSEEKIDKTDYYNDERGIFERSGHRFDYDEGNPDIYADMNRPCQVYDTFCIRKFFAEHSQCKISGRAVPEPLYRAQGNVNFASANISETQVNAAYGGLNNARVVEFYINKVTDNLIIAFTFDNATKYSNNTYFRFYLRGREPVVTRDFGGIQYGVLTVTVIIPQLKNLRLDKAEIYTYGDTNIYPFTLGPGIGASMDPEPTSMYARFYSNIPTEYQEEISNQGNFMAGNYIQYNICDFGLKVL